MTSSDDACRIQGKTSRSSLKSGLVASETLISESSQCVLDPIGKERVTVSIP